MKLKPWVKEFIRGFRYVLGVLCTFWLLRMLILIRLYGSYTAIEPNIALLYLEIIAFAIALALQLVPLKEKKETK